MKALERLHDRFVDVRSFARVFRHVGRLVPSSRTNPATLVEHWATQTPTAPALAFEDERYTWAELDAHANRYAAYLHGRGIGAGDVVAMVMDNRPAFLFALIGLNKLGAVGALINTNLTGTALAHAIRVASPKKVLSGAEHVEPVVEALGELDDLSEAGDLWVVRDGDGAEPTSGRVIDADVAALGPENRAFHRPRGSETYCFIYTSGTTGLPKAAIISNQRMLAAATVFGETMTESGPGETTYVALPLYHSSAMYIGFGSALARGGAIALRRKFSASNFWADVRRHDATSILYIGRGLPVPAQHAPAGRRAGPSGQGRGRERPPARHLGGVPGALRGAPRPGSSTGPRRGTSRS